MTIKRIITCTLMIAGIASISAVNADPRPINPNIRVQKFKLPPLNLKPNLVVKALGWSGEFCNRSKCYNEFKPLGFNKATCKFRARVKNLGTGTAGRFRVKLEYKDWKGTIRRTTVVVAGLKRKGQFGSEEIVYFNVQYYKLNQMMKVTVDPSRQVTETNENDNISYYRTTY